MRRQEAGRPVSNTYNRTAVPNLTRTNKQTELPAEGSGALNNDPFVLKSPSGTATRPVLLPSPPPGRGARAAVLAPGEPPAACDGTGARTTTSPSPPGRPLAVRS